MFPVIRSVFILAIMAFSALAQDSNQNTQNKSLAAGLIETENLPHNFAAFGVGLKSGTALTGLSSLCHDITILNYVCVGSKFNGSTTANTVSLKQVIFAKQGFVVALNGNVGLATGADSGTGAAYAAGGSVLYNVSRLPILKSKPGYYLGFSGEWDKRDVKEFVSARTTAALRNFGSRGVYGFFVGKAW